METAYGETISPHDVVIANGEIGAVMIAWVGHGKVGEELLVTGRAVDLAVHPKHQGKRYARLINFPSTVRNEYREDYFGFDTRPNAAPVLHMHDNETVARGVRVWTRPFGVLRTVAGVRHALGQRVVTTQLVDTLSHRHAPRRSTARRIQVEPVARFDERADALWERGGRGIRCRAGTRRADPQLALSRSASGPDRDARRLRGRSRCSATSRTAAPPRALR